MSKARHDSFTSSMDINSVSTDIRTLQKTGREVAQNRWITVEPLLILGSMSSAGLLVARLQYLRERIELDKFNQSDGFDANMSTCYTSLANSSEYIIQQAIQVELSLYSLILNVVSTFPAIFTTILIGSLSDRVGRRVGLVTPLIGLVVQCALYVAIFYAQLPLWVSFIADTLQGITGGYGLILSTASAYIADITDTEQRIWRIVIAEGALVLGAGLIQPINGFVIQYFGMGVAFSGSLGLGLLGLLYSVCPLTTPETMEDEVNETFCEYVKDIFRGIYRLLSINTGGRRAKIALLCLSELFMNTCINGFPITSTYGLGPPYCWGPSVLGYFTAASSILPVLGVTVAVKLLSYCLTDMWVIHCGTAMLLATFLVTGLAPSTTVLFIGLIPYSIGCLVSPVLKGILSIIVDEHEQGSIFALAGCIVNISQFIGPLVSNAIYASTVSTFAPLVFYVFAGVLVIPITLNGIVQKLGVAPSSRDGYSRIPGNDDTS